jgi:ABC-type sugar transport system ATPase subunit
MNFYSATVHDGAIELADGTRIPCDGVSRNGGSTVEVGVRPEDVTVDGDGAEATAVREIQRGHYKELVLTVGGDEVRAFVGAETAASERSRVRFRRAVVYGDETA